MSKYSFEFKKKIVDEYNNKVGGYRYLTEKYGIADNKLLRYWVANYNAFGDEGLLPVKKRKEYSFETKLYVVNLYLSSEISYRDLAIQQGILNQAVITHWVNLYRIGGPDALKPRMKGKKKTLSKDKVSRRNSANKKETTDTSVQHVKELEDELLKLRIENAFLKELRRLRLEDAAKMREQRKSSAASEDSSL